MDENEVLWDAMHRFLAFFETTIRGLDTPELNRDMLQAYEGMARVLTQLTILSPIATKGDIPLWVSALVEVTQSTNPSLMCSVGRTFVQVLGGPLEDHIRAYLMGAPVCRVTEHLWCMMHVDVSADVMIVQLLLDLHDVVVAHHQPHAVCRVLESLVGSDSEQKLDAVARYATIWRNAHLREHQLRNDIFPGVMKQVLDCLEVADPALRHHARSWITVDIWAIFAGP